MTALERELKRLAIREQPSLKEIGSGKCPSLLFSAEKAADVSVEEIYSHAKNELEKLILIDEIFTEFESTLFQENCKEFERTNQTKEVLIDVDDKIGKFLRCLSPYFMFEGSPWCLEWLIRVFRINTNNTDALMECVLPFYQTNRFARVVQLLPLEDHTSKWYWLCPIKKTGSPLSKLTLIQHCLSDQPFLVFICEMVLSSIRAHRNSPVGTTACMGVINLYISTISGVLEGINHVSEELVLRLMPYVKKGLKSKNVNYRASTYIVLSQLAAVANMDDKLVRSMVTLVSKSLGASLLKEGLCCVAVLCHTQKLSKLSDRALHYFLRTPSLVESLSSLTQANSLTFLLSALLSSLLDAHLGHFHGNQGDDGDRSEAVNSLLERLLDEITLDNDTAYSLIIQLLEGIIHLCEEIFEENKKWKKFKERLKSTTSPLAQSLDTKYPLMMDKALEFCISSVCSSVSDTSDGDLDSSDVSDDCTGSGGRERVNHKLKFLHDFIASSLPHSRHQVLVDVGSTLVLSIHHPNPSVRAAAVGRLGKTLKSKSKGGTSSGLDGDFVSSCFQSRLADEDPTVVQATLDLGPKVLCKHLSSADLIPCLAALLSKKKLYRASSDWQPCALKTLSVLTSKSLLESAPEAIINDVIIVGIPLLFVGRNGNEFGGRVLEVMKGSALAKVHPLLASLREISRKEAWVQGCEKENHRDEGKLALANALVFSHLGQQISQLEPAQLNQMLSKLTSKACSTPTDNHQYFTLMAVLVSCLKTTPLAEMETQHHEIIQLLTHVQQNLEVLEGGVTKGRMFSSSNDGLVAVFLPLVEKHLDKVLSHRLLLLWILEGISGFVTIPTNLSANMWLDVLESSSEEQLYYHVLLSLFSVLTHLIDLQLESKGQGVTGPCKRMLQNMMTNYFSRRGTLLRFLAMIWTTPLGMELGSFLIAGLTPVLQSRSLSIACAFLKSLDVQAAVALLGNHCPVVPSLLIPLASPHALIREKALDCLLALQEACSSVYPLPDLSHQSKPQVLPNTSCPSTLQLVHNITKYKLEISSDSSQISHVLNTLHQAFSSTSSLNPPPPTPSKRRSKRLASGSDSGACDGGERASNSVEWLECVMMHIVSLGMPSYLQGQLLTVVHQVDHIFKVMCLYPLLMSMMEEMTERKESMETDSSNSSSHVLTEHRAQSLELSIKNLTPTIASSLAHHMNIFSMLIKLLKMETPCTEKIPSPQVLALNQVTPEFFESLDSHELQQTLLQNLVDLLLQTKLPEVTILIKNLVNKLPLTAELVSGELSRDTGQMEEDLVILPTPSKKRRVKATKTTPTETRPEGGVVSLPWKRITLLLELIEHHCPTIVDSHQLVPLLFNILNRCLELEECARFELEYTQQLLLACLLNISNHIVNENKGLLVESQFNVELVVQCIRLSSNPQTHHHALLFLSSAAAIFPGLVLHNVMPIFTFMGANVLRQDDLYSFQIITKTIDTVIPPLIKSGSVTPSNLVPSSASKRHSSKATPTTVESVVTEIIRIFVDAVPHIPDHRKIPLFTHLLETIGSCDYLHVALGLLMEKQVLQQSDAKDGKNKPWIDVAFIVSVAQEFSPGSQILAAFKLAQYVSQLPEEKPSTAFKLRHLPASVCALFNVASHTSEQLHHFKSLTLSLLASLLSQKTFIKEVSTLVTNGIEANIIKLLQCMLGYISSLNKSLNAGKRSLETFENPLKTLLQKSYLVVDKVTALLPPISYLEVMSQLIGVVSKKEAESGLSTGTRKKALDMLLSKLEDPKTCFTKDLDLLLLELIDILMGVACEGSTSVSSRQVALNCVQLLVQRVTATHSQKIMKVTGCVIEVMADPNLPVPVRSSCLLCVVELTLSLGPHLIPLLPLLLPQVLHHLATKRRPKGRRQMQLQLNATAALQSVVKTLPNFLSSFITEIILKLCHSGIVGSKDHELTKLEKESEDIRCAVSREVPVRQLLPAYLKCCKDTTIYEKDSMLALLSMLSATVTKLSKEDCKVYSDLLVDIFLTCLDYRTQETKDLSSLGGIEAVEDRCLDAFTALVVKLSEVQFRALFLKLLDWATNPKSPRLRLITFYHLTDRVAEKLKGLFLLFAGHCITSIVHSLDSNHNHKNTSLFFDVSDESEGGDDNLAESESCLLLQYILQCLTKCFLYDKSSFLTKERFDALLQPLVDQITNTMGGVKEYTRRVETQLTGCLAYFGIAAGKESLWKPLNYQLLLKTRHKSAQVRFGTLKVLQELYLKLGEEFMPLLPETVPFLYELLEDESEEVEQLTREVKGTIEDILGESIEQYF